MQILIPALMAFLSGFVALGYEILWARRLSDIIGATSFASSLVVGVFFLSLSLGAIALGPRAARATSPWRWYAQLELAILLTILPSFFGESLSGLLLQVLGDGLLAPTGSFFVKSLLAVLFVAAPSFLMGGTLPAMGQAVVRMDRLGSEGNLLYGTNTLGGALGILVTTFFCVPMVGMRFSFLCLMLGSLLLAGGAWKLSKHSRYAAPPMLQKNKQPSSTDSTQSPWTWNAMAFMSGFNILGLEILALHLFSQILHNSTYTFACVLLVVVASLAVGALITQRWQLTAKQAWLRLTLALCLAAIATAVLPKFFVSWTHGMLPFGGGDSGFALYIFRILGACALLIGPSFILLGWVFPLILAGTPNGSVGRNWGRLLFFNALGALLGLGLANHVAMEHLGLWFSWTLWTVVFLITAALALLRSQVRMIPAVMLALALLTLFWGWPSTLPIARVGAQDRIVAWSSGPDGIAAVIDANGDPKDRRIKWNNTYSLGGSSNVAQQIRLGTIPLLLHPHPKNTAFIGLATGITASAALNDPAQPRVTTVELSPQITQLACEHFARFNKGICSQQQSSVVVEDGRLFFRATRQRFDVVVGDLFVPWRSGVANLFTREHFQAVRRSLSTDGLYAQWLPLFQLDAKGFWGIASTFCDVFPNAYLAIADFQPNNPAVALIGWKRPAGAPNHAILQQRTAEFARSGKLREPMLASAEGAGMFLVGPVQPELPRDIQIMTLDRPWLADHAPRVERMRPTPIFRNQALTQVLQRMAAGSPPGPLRQASLLGQRLYQFCDVHHRQGAKRAAAWYQDQGPKNLPTQVFGVARPERFDWPFTQETGMFLLREALRQRKPQR